MEEKGRKERNIEVSKELEHDWWQECTGYKSWTAVRCSQVALRAPEQSSHHIQCPVARKALWRTRVPVTHRADEVRLATGDDCEIGRFGPASIRVGRLVQAEKREKTGLGQQSVAVATLLFTSWLSLDRK
jgi:hypothetical protein